MTARPIRRNAQTPDRNGKIFYTSTTSLSHISKRFPPHTGVIVDSLPGATCNIGIANANGVELKNKLRVPVHGECHIFPDKGQYYSARVSTYDKPGSGSFRVLY